nr:hypothetical protein [Halomicroarcula amylolytica]
MEYQTRCYEIRVGDGHLIVVAANGVDPILKTLGLDALAGQFSYLRQVSRGDRKVGFASGHDPRQIGESTPGVDF